MANPVEVVLDGQLARLIMSSPPVNALGSPMLEAIDRAVDEATHAGVKVVIVGSAVDGVFAAGADIKKMRDLDLESFETYHHEMRATFARLTRGPFITVAAIDGLALGGGLELALACSLRVASKASRLGLPESKLGLIPGAGGTQRLPQLVGRGRAMDLLMTGRTVLGTEAAAIGLVDRLVEPGAVLDTADELGLELSERSRAGLLAIERCVDAAFDLDFESGLRVETSEEMELFRSGEVQEGLRAFLERRTPKFS